MKKYKISVQGSGAEVVYGYASLQQYEFWNDVDRLRDAGFFDMETAIIDYMHDPESWDATVPKTARFTKDWKELDQYAHYQGALVDSCFVTVQRLDQDSKPILLVWQGSLEEFLQTKYQTTDVVEFVLDDQELNTPYVFYGMSDVQTEMSILFQEQEDVDFQKLHMDVVDLPIGEKLLVSFCYDQQIADYNTDKESPKYMEIWKWQEEN